MVREARQQALHRRSARLALTGPLSDTRAIDRDEGEFRRNKTGVGNDECERSEKSYGGVDQNLRAQSCMGEI